MNSQKSKFLTENDDDILSAYSAAAIVYNIINL